MWFLFVSRMNVAIVVDPLCAALRSHTGPIGAFGLRRGHIRDLTGSATLGDDGGPFNGGGITSTSLPLVAADVPASGHAVGNSTMFINSVTRPAPSVNALSAQRNSRLTATSSAEWIRRYSRNQNRHRGSQTSLVGTASGSESIMTNNRHMLAKRRAVLVFDLVFRDIGNDMYAEETVKREGAGACRETTSTPVPTAFLKDLVSDVLLAIDVHASTATGGTAISLVEEQDNEAVCSCAAAAFLVNMYEWRCALFVVQWFDLPKCLLFTLSNLQVTPLLQLLLVMATR